MNDASHRPEARPRITRHNLERSITDEIERAAESGDVSARCWDWSGPGDEDGLVALIIEALKKLGVAIEED